MTPSIPDDLVAVLARFTGEEHLRLLLLDLLTPAEIKALGERWHIICRLAAGDSQRAVRDALGVSISTVSRGSRQLRYGHGGFALAFDAMAELGLDDPRGAGDGDPAQEGEG